MTPEEQFVRAFVLPGRQRRLLALLASPKKRRKLTDILAHFADLDPRFAIHIPPAQQKASTIEKMLRERGAPDMCFAFSENKELDGRVMPLGDAIEAVVGYGFGTFLSCVPGQLGYFESEEINERYLLVRNEH
jgi:hypothetical protein